MSTETLKALLDERLATKILRERSGQSTELVGGDINSLLNVINMLERMPTPSPSPASITPEILSAYMVEKSNEYEAWSTTPKECNNPIPVVEQLTRIMYARLPGAFTWLTTSDDVHAQCREQCERERKAWIQVRARFSEHKQKNEAWRHEMQNKMNLLQKTFNKH
jgi:hypothetical protein